MVDGDVFPDCQWCGVLGTGVQIASYFVIIITDFGLSEDIFVTNYFRQGSTSEVVKLPVKWMAPESLSDGHFSEKSDVVGQEINGEPLC